MDFYALAPRMVHTGRMARWAASRLPVTFVAFDLLFLDDQDLTGRPLRCRQLRVLVTMITMTDAEIPSMPPPLSTSPEAKAPIRYMRLTQNGRGSPLSLACSERGSRMTDNEIAEYREHLVPGLRHSVEP